MRPCGHTDGLYPRRYQEGHAGGQVRIRRAVGAMQSEGSLATGVPRRCALGCSAGVL